jgi:hypothetical protein
VEVPKNTICPDFGSDLPALAVDACGFVAPLPAVVLPLLLLAVAITTAPTAAASNAARQII